MGFRLELTDVVNELSSGVLSVVSKAGQKLTRGPFDHSTNGINESFLASRPRELVRHPFRQRPRVDGNRHHCLQPGYPFVDTEG